MSENAKRIRKLSQTDIMNLLGDFWDMTEEDIRAIIKDPKTTLGRKAMANIFLKVSKGADIQSSSFILDRMVGKVRDEINLTDDRDLDLEEIPRDKLVALVSGE